MTLTEAFRDWLDFDGAEFELAKCLGLMPNVAWDPLLKGLFWTNNVFSNGLYKLLEDLVAMGALEQNDEQQFRWNAAWDHTKAAGIVEAPTVPEDQDGNCVTCGRPYLG